MRKAGLQRQLPRARRDWDILKGMFHQSHRQITRIATRYINRLDIPVGEVRPEAYITVLPTLPDKLTRAVSQYGCQVVFEIPDKKLSAIVNTGSVEPPLINHSSILVDVDVFREVDVPQNDADMWSLVDDLRTVKNQVFEAIVTDKARELFREGEK